MSERLPQFQYTNRDFTSVKAALQDWVRDNKPELWNDFFESNLGDFLIDLVAYHDDLLSFAIDRVSEEAFLASNRLYKSALKHAKMLSYLPLGATSASVTVRVDPLPSNISVYGVLVRGGTQVSLGNDLVFEVDRDYSFPAGSTEMEFTLIEGTSQEDEFTSDGSNFQRFTSLNNKIIQDSWRVYVDDVEWTYTEYVELEPYDSRTYSIEYLGDRAVTIRFGNDITGKVPPNGSTIRLEYRTGGGERGNIPSEAINTTIAAEQNAAVITLNIINDSAAGGGSDRETLSHIQRWAPLNVRTVDKCIVAEDFDTEASSFADPTYGRIARAKAELREGTLAVPDPTPAEQFTTVGDTTTDQSVGNYAGTFNDQVAMSFQLSSPIYMWQLLMYIHRVGDIGIVNLRIETDNAGAPSGNLVHPAAHYEFAETEILTSANWARVRFENAFRVESATTYWIVFEIQTDPGAGNYIVLHGDQNDTYANGFYAYHPDGGSWTAGTAPQIVDAAFMVKPDPYTFLVEFAYDQYTEYTVAESLGNQAGIINDQVAMQVTTTSTMTLSRVQMYLEKFGFPGDINVRIETDNAGAPSGTLVFDRAYATVNSNNVYGVGWIEMLLDSQGALPAGTYWIVLSVDDRSTNLGDGGVTDYWEQSTANPNEYYFKGTMTAQPEIVRENVTDLVEQLPNTPLGLGEWSWAKKDGQLTENIYIRLTDDTDPDTKPLGYLKAFIQPMEVGSYYSVYGTLADGYAGGKYRYRPETGSWTDGTEIVDAAFRLESGGRHVVHADDPITIDGLTYYALSEFALYGRNVAMFVDPNTVDIWTWVETTDIDGRRTYTTPSAALRAALLEHVDERSVITTISFVHDGPMVSIDLDLGDVVVNARYDLDTVYEAILDGIEDFFMDDSIVPGSAFRVSDFYDYIEEIPGVEHFVERSYHDDIEVESNEMIIRGSIQFNTVYPPMIELRDITARY